MAQGETVAENELEGPLAVYGDAAYGAGVLSETLEAADVQTKTKVQPPTAPGGRFPKDAFTLDLGAAGLS